MWEWQNLETETLGNSLWLDGMKLQSKYLSVKLNLESPLIFMVKILLQNDKNLHFVHRVTHVTCTLTMVPGICWVGTVHCDMDLFETSFETNNVPSFSLKSTICAELPTHNPSSVCEKKVHSAFQNGWESYQIGPQVMKWLLDNALLTHNPPQSMIRVHSASQYTWRTLPQLTEFKMVAR